MSVFGLSIRLGIILAVIMALLGIGFLASDMFNQYAQNHRITKVEVAISAETQARIDATTALSLENQKRINEGCLLLQRNSAEAVMIEDRLNRIESKLGIYNKKKFTPLVPTGLECDTNLKAAILANKKKLIALQQRVSTAAYTMSRPLLKSPPLPAKHGHKGRHKHK